MTVKPKTRKPAAVAKTIKAGLSKAEGKLRAKQILNEIDSIAEARKQFARIGA